MVGGDRPKSRGRRYVAEICALVRNNAWMATRLRETNHPVLHCNDEVALLNFGLGARLIGCPVLFHVRDTRGDRNLYRLLRWKAFLGLSTAFVTLSREMSDWWLRYLSIAGKPPAGASKVCHLYSVAPEILPAPRKNERELRLTPQLVVGVVGAFSPKKGQLELLENCCRALAVEGFEFRFFGDMDVAPAYSLRCREAAGDMIGRRIFFFGHINDPRRIYGGLDVVVIASRHEGLARAMIEALAAGVPVVSFAVCSAREILADHGVGIVVPQGDYPSLVRTLRAIAHERARLADMSGRAQVVAKTLFAPGAQASAYKKLLGELCHARRVAR